MILILLAHAWKINQDRHSYFLEDCRIANARALQDLRRTEGTGGYDNEFVGFDDLVNRLAEHQDGLMFCVGLVFDSDGSRWIRVVEQDSDGLGFSQDM